VRAVPAIRTEPFEETWIDFLRAWPRVRFPRGAEPMTGIVERAQRAEPPACAAGFEQPQLRLLAALCRELQRAAGASPFYLSCRTAARVLGLANGRGEPDHVKAWRWLFLLAEVGILREVEKGQAAKRRATRWHYQGGD
jgi:hypothetical protein